MKKLRLFLVTLTLIAASSLGMADLRCTEVDGCQGNAGCAFGDPDGCLITCSDGILISCNYKPIEEIEILE